MDKLDYLVDHKVQYGNMLPISSTCKFLNCHKRSCYSLIKFYYPNYCFIHKKSDMLDNRTRWAYFSNAYIRPLINKPSQTICLENLEINISMDSYIDSLCNNLTI